MDPISLIPAIKSTIDIFKGLRELFKDNPEAITQLNDINFRLLDVNEKALGLVERLAIKQKLLEQAEEKLRFDEVLTYKNQMIWRSDKEEEDKGPYCPVCWGKDRQLVHLMYNPSESVPTRAEGSSSSDFDRELFGDMSAYTTLEAYWRCGACDLIIRERHTRQLHDR